jgi:hypothetical protein
MVQASIPHEHKWAVLLGLVLALVGAATLWKKSSKEKEHTEREIGEVGECEDVTEEIIHTANDIIARQYLDTLTVDDQSIPKEAKPTSNFTTDSLNNIKAQTVNVDTSNLMSKEIEPNTTALESTKNEKTNLKKYAIHDEKLPEFLKVSPKKTKKIKSPVQKSPSLSPLKSRVSPLNYTIQDMRSNPHTVRSETSTSPSPGIRYSMHDRNTVESNDQRSDSVSSKSSTSSIYTLSSVSSSKHRATEIWEPDNASKTCRVCSIEFGMLNRKHHCRKW